MEIVANRTDHIVRFVSGGEGDFKMAWSTATGGNMLHGKVFDNHS
jgi:hypothetical protein